MAFAGDLRSRVFRYQSQAAKHFRLSRPTITRYENGIHKPPLGYLTCLVCLLVERQEQSVADTYRRTLLHAINQAIRDHYQEPAFQSWDELCAVADEYLTKRQNPTDSVDTAFSPAKNQNVPISANLTISPAEAPPLPHFFVKRPAIQGTLLDKIKRERVPTLVLWGAGGTGKSTLAAWLAKTMRTDFPDGQVWVELLENLSPDETIVEVQTHIARSFGIVLSATSSAERAGQLRTLLSNKRCLIILDNVWITSGLAHLQVVNEQSSLFINTRSQKVADILEVPFIQVNGMTAEEGLALLTKWAGYPVTTTELVHRLGGLPLALKLCGVQLREGRTPVELLAYFHHQNIDLSLLDLDNPQDAAESIQPYFNRSFNHLTPTEQERFAQLGCFASRFETVGSAKIWGINLNQVQHLLRRLHSSALVERKGGHYQLHPLLRDYARLKLASSIVSQTTYRRHAAYYIRAYLYHPQVLDEVTREAPKLDESWPDIVGGVTWAAKRDPQLATIAALLAHTERPALLEVIGSPLLTAIETYLADITDNKTEQAILHELLGDLQLLSEDLETALSHFAQAATLWQTDRDHLSSSRAILRMAGIHLLRQDKLATAEALHQAQTLLAESLPITEADLESTRWLFYWFDLVYSVFVRWGDIDLLEKNIVEFAELAQQTGQPLLEARGWHIYRLFHTTKEVPHTQETRQRGRQYAAKAARLWCRHGEKDKALAEVMWTQEQTKGRRSQRMAEHFARRLSRATPKLSQEQIGLIENERIRRWLGANEEERVEWLVKELPPPGDDDWQALEDILSISTMGERARRIARGLPRPDGHLVSEPIWKILTGQRAVPLSGEAAAKVVHLYLSVLDAELG